MNSNQLSGLCLEDLLPHRAPMLLIDQILEVDSGHALTLSRVAGTWPLADRHGVAPLIMVELAAQTAGVCNGWDRIRTQGLGSDQMGWLVAVKRADFFIDHLPIGTSVMVKAENTLSFDKFREVTSRVYDEDRLLAEVILQLYQA